MPFGGEGPRQRRRIVADSAALEIRAKRAGVVRLVFTVTAEGGPATLRITGGNREADVHVNGTVPVSFPVAVPRGLSQLSLRADNAATVAVSQPRAEPTAAAPVLNAPPLSADPGF